MPRARTRYKLHAPRVSAPNEPQPSGGVSGAISTTDIGALADSTLAAFDEEPQIDGNVTLLPLAIQTETALLRWRLGHHQELDVILGAKLGYALQLGDTDWSASSEHDPDPIELAGPEVGLGGPFASLSLGIEWERVR